MQKVYIIITSVLLALLILGFCGYFFIFHRQTPVWDITTTVKPDIVAPTYEQQRLSVEKQNEQNSELYNTAMQDQNISLCTNISDEEQRSQCSDMIMATTARKSDAIESCDTLSSTGAITLCHDVILSDRAIAATNRTLCGQVEDREMRSQCEGSVDEIQLTTKTRENAITREFCDTLGDQYQSICLTQIREIDETRLYRDALAKSDIRICEQITEIKLKTTCLDTVKLKSAVSPDSTTACNSISDTDKRLYCETQVSRAADIALYKSAITGTDPSMCTSIVNTNLENKCHDTIIIATVKIGKNILLCDGLTATGMISACRAIGQQ